nr:unnamed protein product [Digitaria exilis]
MAVEKTLDFCVDKVLAEEDDGYLVGAADGSDIDLVADSLTANTMAVENGGSMDGGAVDVEPTAFSLDGGVFIEGVCYGGTPAVAVVVADTMESPVAAIPELEVRPGRLQGRCAAARRRGAASAPPCSRAGLQLRGHGAPLPDALVAAGGIKEIVMQPTRSSPRLAGAVDCHIMEKAKSRATWKNLDCPEYELFDNDEEDNYELENLTLGHLCGDFLWMKTVIT